MDKFLYTVGQPVKDKGTGEVGTVDSCDRESTTNVPFYRVRFANGEVRSISENELWPM